MDMHPLPSPFWCVSASESLERLGRTTEGLSSAEASQRFARHGLNLLKPSRRSNVLHLLLAQFKSPIILIFLFATGLSFVLRDPVKNENRSTNLCCDLLGIFGPIIT